MKGTILGVLLGAGLLALASCAYTEKSLEEKGLSPLTETELKEIFSRTRTVRLESYAGSKGTVKYYDNGQLEGADIWGNPISGSWAIRYGQLWECYEKLGIGWFPCYTYKTGSDELTIFKPPDRSYYKTLVFID